MTDADYLRMVCYHEAGHTVAAVLLDLGFEAAAVTQVGGNGAGIAVCNKDPTLWDTTESVVLAEGFIVQRLAGVCAERVLGYWYTSPSDTDDAKHIARTIGPWCRVPLKKGMQACYDAAYNLLIDNWWMVEEVADMLLKRGIVQRAEVLEALGIGGDV